MTLKSNPTVCATLAIFKKWSKVYNRSLHMRKFAQSGHPKLSSKWSKFRGGGGGGSAKDRAETVRNWIFFQRPRFIGDTVDKQEIAEQCKGVRAGPKMIFAA
jgi:hypothetical protein